MIPKNRDNSGTALLYIVGPDSVRPGFRRANVRDEPRRVCVSSRADGSIAWLGSLSTTRLGPTCFTFVLADGRGDSIDIEAMGPTDSLSELVEILDD